VPPPGRPQPWSATRAQGLPNSGAIPLSRASSLWQAKAELRGRVCVGGLCNGGRLQRIGSISTRDGRYPKCPKGIRSQFVRGGIGGQPPAPSHARWGLPAEGGWGSAGDAAVMAP